MTYIVEFESEDGSSIFVELKDTSDRISLGDEIAEKARQSFESSLNAIKPIANAVVQKVQDLNRPADEVEVKFGIKMNAKLGAVIASGNGEVNYEVVLKWKNTKSNG